MNSSKLHSTRGVFKLWSAKCIPPFRHLVAIGGLGLMLRQGYIRQKT